VAVTWTSPGIGWASATDAITYTSGTITPAGDGQLVVFAVEIDGNTATDWVMTDSLGGSWSKVGRAVFTTSADFVELWVRITPDNLSTYTVTFSHASGNATGSTGRVLRASGITAYGLAAIRKGAGDVLQVVNVDNGAAAGTPAATLPEAIRASSGALMLVGNAANPPGITSPAAAGWSRVVDAGHNTPVRGLDVMRLNGDTGGGSATVTCGSTSATSWGALLVEFDGTYVNYAPPRIPRRIAPGRPFLPARPLDTSAAAAAPIVTGVIDARSSGRAEVVPSLAVQGRIDGRDQGRAEVAAKVTTSGIVDARSSGRAEVRGLVLVQGRIDARSMGRAEAVGAISGTIVTGVIDARSSSRAEIRALLVIPARADSRSAARGELVAALVVIGRTDQRSRGRADAVGTVTTAGTVTGRADGRSSSAGSLIGAVRGPLIITYEGIRLGGVGGPSSVEGAEGPASGAAPSGSPVLESVEGATSGAAPSGAALTEGQEGPKAGAAPSGSPLIESQ